MIRAEYVWQYLRALQAIPQNLRDHEVIEAPPHVACPGSRSIAPPGIVPLTLFEFAKRIDESRFDDGIEVRSFLVRESSISSIRLRIRQILLRMGHIQIAAKHDGLSRLQFLHPFQESGIPLLPVRQSL